MDQYNQGPAPSVTSMGDEYDPTAAYAVKDLCIHDNKLMKCTTAIATGGEAWNDAHWAETTIADEINELNSKIIKESFSQQADNLKLLSFSKKNGYFLIGCESAHYFAGVALENGIYHLRFTNYQGTATDPGQLVSGHLIWMQE